MLKSMFPSLIARLNSLSALNDAMPRFSLGAVLLHKLPAPSCHPVRGPKPKSEQWPREEKKDKQHTNKWRRDKSHLSTEQSVWKLPPPRFPNCVPEVVAAIATEEVHRLEAAVSASATEMPVRNFC